MKHHHKNTTTPPHHHHHKNTTTPTQKHHHHKNKTPPHHHKNTTTTTTKTPPPPTQKHHHHKNKTPPHHHKNTTTPPQKHHHTTTPPHHHTTTPPHHHTTTTTTATTPPQKTPPHHHKNTTTPPHHHHKNTTTPPHHHHKNTTIKTPPQKHHHTTIKTPPQKHHHTTTKTPLCVSAMCGHSMCDVWARTPKSTKITRKNEHQFLGRMLQNTEKYENYHEKWTSVWKDLVKNPQRRELQICFMILCSILPNDVNPNFCWYTKMTANHPVFWFHCYSWFLLVSRVLMNDQICWSCWWIGWVHFNPSPKPSVVPAIQGISNPTVWADQSDFQHSTPPTKVIPPVTCTPRKPIVTACAGCCLQWRVNDGWWCTWGRGPY